MNQERETPVTLWITEDLPSIVKTLKEFAPELAKNPLQHFQAIVEQLITIALEKFMLRHGITSSNAFTNEDRETFLIHTVSSLNSALPLDYPFIVFVLIDETTNKRYPAAARRKLIPGAHDILKNNIVPVIKCKGQRPFQPGDQVSLKKIELETSATRQENDTLENMWKKS